MLKNIMLAWSVPKPLTLRGIPFVSQKECSIFYKGEPLKQTYRMDLVTHGTIIVELKAVKSVLPEHKAIERNNLDKIFCQLG